MSNSKIYVHEEVIQEEGLKLSELPDNIKKRIAGFNLMKKRWEKNPEDEREERQLQKLSVKIGDMIMDFVETDFDEDEDEEEDEDKDNVSGSKDSGKNKEDKKSEPKSDVKEEEEKEEEGKGSKKTTEKTSENSKEDTNNRKPKTGKFGNLMMEKKILAIMEARGDKKIKISDLESIIGREPDYPQQEVNNITLRKVFLASDYRLL
jgi:hypothetical protein